MADRGEDLLQPPAVPGVEDGFERALASAATPSLSHGQKIDMYREIVVSIFSTLPLNVSQAKRFVQEVLSDAVPLPVSSRAMDFLLEKLHQIEDNRIHEDLALDALTKMQPRVASFGKQAFLLRQSMAELYESEDKWSRAADILMGIDFESVTWIIDNQTKFAKYVHIALLRLEDQDVLQAEPCINMASTIVDQISKPDLMFKYKVCNAECLDLKLKFLEAAKEYYDISKITQRQIGTIEIIEEEMKDSLNSAVVCALLSGASPERSRVLVMLSQDERCSKLNIYPVLQKVIFGEFLNEEDIASVEKELMPHHKNALTNNSTFLETMMIEHNLLYTNTENNSSIDLFKSMLLVDPEKVTRSAAIMSTSSVRNALRSVKDEIAKAQHTLQLQRDIYAAYAILEPDRRQHLDTTQAHERAERGYSELTESIQDLINEATSELDAAIDNLGSLAESVDQ